MSKVNDLLYVAASQLGYCADDDPEPGSKYGRWMAELLDEDWLAGPSRDVWWCCIFVSWCLDQADVECNGFPSYNTNIVLRNAGDARLDDIHDAQPGDVIIFDWNHDGYTDHVGIVEANFGDWIQTIEGNVSNSVQRVARDWDYVAAIVRPNFEAQPECDPDIRFMQLLLNAQLQQRGCPEEMLINANGVYNKRTADMIIRIMQEFYLCTYSPDISCDTQWDPEFYHAIDKRPVCSGARNASVWATKAALIGKGYKGEPLNLEKWNFSAGLTDIVVDFQKDHGLPPTGCVESDTFFFMTHEV